MARILVSACFILLSLDVIAEYTPEMWEYLEYDSILTVEQLQEAGWVCAPISKTDEGFDGMCGPYQVPRFSIFGVPTAASSVFLEQQRSASVNIGIHETSQEFVLKNLTRVLGKPTGVKLYQNNCTVEWLVGRLQYSFHTTALEGAYARLYINFPHRIVGNKATTGINGKSGNSICLDYAGKVQI